MAPAKMQLQADEELGKKDDDHRFPKQRRFRPFQRSNVARSRRVMILLIVCIILYQFFKHMPTDLTPAAERYNPPITKPRPSNPGPSGNPLRYLANQKIDNEVHDKVESYESPIKFDYLAQSLPNHEYPKGQASNSVIFAGSSLRCISDLLPLACRMGSANLNRVHFVLLGRDEVTIDGIKQVNGVTDPECPIVWHDGRPNNAAQSSDARLERSVIGGLKLIQEFIAPEVIITQRQEWENPFLWNGLQFHKIGSETPHIVLPSASRNLMWIASLRSHALRFWNKIQIDMVVHASQSSGALVRLIRSLDAADYLGTVPRLTIELPPLMESQLLVSLQSLRLSQLQGHITLRRRVEPRYMDPADSSLRTVESFYPLNPSTTHLLLLSPQAELAPSFFIYLMFNVLRYKQYPGGSSASSELLGISLELPRSHPSSENTPFIPPPPPPPSKSDMGRTKEHIPLFLWQSPNSNAALYFGDKWIEFHSFLSSRLDSEGRANAASRDKLVSKRYPAFMDYILDMMQEKGYYMIYPTFPGHGSSPLATVHTEMHQLPEEFAESLESAKFDESSHRKTDDDIHIPQGSIVDEMEDLIHEKPVSRESSISSLLDTFESGLPDIDALPLLSYDGKSLHEKASASRTKTFLGRYLEDLQI